MCSLDCQQDLALLSLPTVAWTLTLHVHDLLNDVYAVLATIVCALAFRIESCSAGVSD